MGLSIRSWGMKKLLTIFREISILALWLCASPVIINYMAVMKIFYPLWFGCIIFGFGSRWIFLLRKKDTLVLPKWLWAMAGISTALAWTLFLLGEIRIIHPLWTAGIIAMGIAVWVFHRIQRLHGPPVIISGLALVVYLFTLGLSSLAFTLIAALVLFGVGRVLTGDTLYKIPGFVVAMAAMNAVIACVVVDFRFQNGGRLDEISKDPSIETLFAYHPDDPIGSQLEGDLFSVRETCKPHQTLLSLHGRGPGLFLLDAQEQKLFPAKGIDSASDDILVDCAEHSAIVGHFSLSGSLHFLDLNNWPEPKRKPISVHAPVSHLLRGPDGRTLFILDQWQRLLAYDIQEGKRTASLRGPDEWCYDERTGQFTVMTEPDFSLMKLSYKEEQGQGKFEITQRADSGIPFYKRLQVFLITGPEPGSFYLSNIWDGSITLYGADLNPIKNTRLDPGLRCMALSKDNKKLLVGGHTSGFLYILHADSLQEEKRLFLGKRMRELVPSKDGRFIYVGSDQGAFRINLDLL